MEITLLNTPQTAMITRIHSFALLHRPMLGLELKEKEALVSFICRDKPYFFKAEILW